MAKKILVLVIEDNRLVRDGLVALLNEQPDLKVIASAEGANAGMIYVREAKPHIVLVDAALGNQDSHRLVESVMKEVPESKVIVMDLLPDREDVIAFIKAGASGFIVKDATVDDVVRTIRAVAEGAQVVPPALTGTLLSHIVDQALTRDSAAVVGGGADDEARAGNYRTDCRGPEQQGDRAAAQHCDLYRQEPRAQYSGEARAAQPTPDCRPCTSGRFPARSAGSLAPPICPPQSS